ncbi:putative bifunctional diguanylate cyclase/phosphodiesterase [Anaerovorax sp. IOR16]|uniref:putative bifunctional diguanylate cyclase/phosphodiesterase n=1 Tax=Anaerovorax sp. IOR16 TaxID=2773458 RepID=UPI0019CFAF5A|nr:GGDEF and EAL domain-containing protein [Anaerovorax sp. IOR16]
MNRKRLMNEQDDLIYVNDLKTQEILFINDAAKMRMGLKDIDCLEKKCYQLIQGLSKPCACCENHLLTSNETYKWDYANHFMEGNYLLRHKLVEWNGQLARMEIAIENTKEENNNQSDLRCNIELILLQAIHDLTQKEDFFGAMELVLNRIGQSYGAQSVYVVEINHTNHGEILYGWCKNSNDKKISLNTQDSLILESWDYLSGGKQWNVLSIGDTLHIVPMVDVEYGDGYFAIECVCEELETLSDILLIGHIILNEITKRRLQNQIEYINNYDALTGTFRRSLYLNHLKHIEEKEPSSMGVLLANINGLKKVNEYYGNEYGDKVVRATGSILIDQFGNKCVFRLSGDEFVVLCENINKKNFHLKVQAVKEEFSQMDHLGVSIGYTWAEEEFELTQLIDHADELMYIEKQQFYTNEEFSIKRNRPKHVKELLKSIENKEYEMYLQPKNDMITGELIGAEALVRYIHPQNGVIPPSKFIPTLERERTIRYIDFFMYEEVCKMMEQWHKQGRKLLPVSLNFSRATILERDFMEQLLLIYGKYDIPYNCIEIEITESMGELEKETLAEISAQMKSEGFAVSLDDFGSEYTNMAILTIMDFDTLKLDRSLVSRLEKSEENRIVVQHVIEMCKEMGVRCLAEGVENENQKKLLREMGCDFAQGYLFNKPLPVSSFEAHYYNH